MHMHPQLAVLHSRLCRYHGQMVHCQFKLVS